MTTQKNTTVNASGLTSYSPEAKQKLAQLASTGCFNNSYYVSAEDQLKTVLDLTQKVEPEFVAKLAVYSRQSAYMKDMPAALVATLSQRDPQLMSRVFPRVIDNGKMLRNFVLMLRTGSFGRKSLGSTPRRLVREWFGQRSDRDLFFSSVGSNPTMGDVLALSHPSPATRERAALYGYFLGKSRGHFAKEEFEILDALPEEVKAYEAFKKKGEGEIPAAPMELLEGLELSEAVWKEIARKASWSQTRQGLNKFQRHGVFKDAEMVQLLSDRLRNPELLKKSRVFPYQLLMAFLATEGTDVPAPLRQALSDAMEISVENVPTFEGNVFVFPDVSGSMSGGSVTGFRAGATSKVTPIQVAALVTACILRKNPQAKIYPFAEGTKHVALDPKDPILVNARKLGALGGGGTNCEAPLDLILARKEKMDLGIYVSDNESNIRGDGEETGWYRRSSSGTVGKFRQIKKLSPEAKLVCIDTSPGSAVQAPTGGDILNIGGFSDSVFNVIESFVKGKSANQWVEEIEAITLLDTQRKKQRPPMASHRGSLL